MIGHALEAQYSSKSNYSKTVNMVYQNVNIVVLTLTVNIKSAMIYSNTERTFQFTFDKLPLLADQ